MINPMPEEVRPVSFLDYANQAAQLKSQHLNQQLTQQRMARAPQEYAMEDNLNQARMSRYQADADSQSQDDNLKKLAAIQKLARDLVTKTEQQGITDPQQQDEYARQYQQAIRPYMENVLGLTGNGDMPYAKIKMLADSTEERERQNKVLDMQAVLPMQKELEQYKHGLSRQEDYERSEREFNQQKDLLGIRQNAATQNEIERSEREFNQQKDLLNIKTNALTGANKPLSAEAAGKLAMLKQAYVDFDEARKMAFDEKGELKKGLLAGANVPFTSGVGENARMLRSRVENAVAAKLRIETGATAPAEEVQNIATRFMPTIMDSKKSADDKFSRLNAFLKEAANLIRPGSVEDKYINDPDYEEYQRYLMEQ